MIGTTALLAAVALSVPSQGPGRSQGPATWPSPAAHVVVVKMVDKGGGTWNFEPSAVQAQPGDTVRFLQTDIVPHNVQFKSVPKGAKLGPTVMMGAFLMKKGDTYDLVIDARFAPGTYHFVCTPHEMMGMKGTLEVGGTKGPDSSEPPADAATAGGNS